MLRRFFVTGKGDICGSFEELFPEFGAFPYVLGMLCVLLNDRENTCGNYPVSTAKVVIDFCNVRQPLQVSSTRQICMTDLEE